MSSVSQKKKKAVELKPLTQKQVGKVVNVHFFMVGGYVKWAATINSIEKGYVSITTTFSIHKDRINGWSE